MRRRDVSWTVALSASLIAHAVLIQWCVRHFFGNHTVADATRRLPNVIIPHPPSEVDQLGDSHGQGVSVDASPGARPMEAPHADEEQSFLRRDPQGISASAAGAAASVEQHRTEEPQPQQQPMAAVEPFGVPNDAPLPAPKWTVHPPQRAVAAARPTPPVVAMAKPSAGGIAAPIGDAAPQAETESDPFAVVGSMDFKPGSTRVRIGRKHKIVDPKLSWDTAYDLFGMTHSTIVLDLQIDASGQVISATVLRSSGSESIDQPCVIAAYQWWFEPDHDAAGRPIRDEIQFTIKFL